MKKLVFVTCFLMSVSICPGTRAQTGSDPEDKTIEDTVKIDLQKAQVLVKKGHKEEATKILTGIMATHPDNREAVQWWLIANMKRSPTGEMEAISQLDSLSISFPSNTGILFFKIFIQAEHGMNQDALTNIERLISVQPDNADNWILNGQILHGLNRHQDACTAFDKALDLNPSRTDVWGMKASSLAKSGQFDESLTLMNKVINQSPDVAENYYNRGCIYCLKNEKENALVDLKRAFTMNPELKRYAMTDEDLKDLFNDNAFIELTK